MTDYHSPPTLNVPTEYSQCVPHILFLPVSHPRLSSFAPDLAAACKLYLQLTKSININSTSSHVHKASQDCYLLALLIWLLEFVEIICLAVCFVTKYI